MDRDGQVAIFTPDNEPYLGLPWVHELDLLISSSAELSRQVGSWTRTASLTDLQRSVAEIAPSAFSIALSIREMVRQGYLLSGYVLLRPLMERAATICHLVQHPEDVPLWESGWAYGGRPTLQDRLRSLASTPGGQVVDGMLDVFKQVVKTYNGLIHGDPVSASFSLSADTGGPIFLASKDLASPERADTLCFDTHLFLLLMRGRIGILFPEPARNAERIRPYNPRTTEVRPTPSDP
ncbi:hypothetical protein [Streptomyces sp. NPDC006879]|uniref:hypothetical protein n=1 Tax=Streptomyces sp. NPDC006879 TaxID=3364767 RepID=UPI0036AD9A0F